MKIVADPILLFALLLLGVWAIGALVMEGPGWIHGLLTVGVFLVIYRIVVRSTAARSGKSR